MTLDFNLIDRSTQHALNSLKSSETVCSGLACISNLLDSELLVKLQNYIFDENLTWGTQELQIGTGIRHDRKKINWIPDSVIEETHMVLEGLTDYINQRFNRQNKFLGLSIWKDEYSYYNPPHIDNPQIDISVQIYLNGNNMDLGTRFQLDSVFTIPYKTNHGYLMDNRQKIMHFYNGKSPENHYRYSLYAIWANTNK